MQTRRNFLRTTALTTAAAVIPPLSLSAKPAHTRKGKDTPSFTLWQIPSHRDTIGNSYVFLTTEGKVIVMDGGFDHEALFLRGFLEALGGEVEAWFISHPHPDHMGALNELLKSPSGLRIKTICHSRLREEVIKAEPNCEEQCREYYSRLESLTDTQVLDIQEAGREFDFGGMKLKVLSVATEFTTNPYNNSSMIMRVWDSHRSILFLGDAGVECGQKVLAGPFAHHLDSDYVQMAHHGQNGCDEDFYRTIHFRACLWPTPTWVWNNDQGKGFNTGILNTIKTRHWMDDLQIKEHHVTCLEGLWKNVE